jgi:hypothetical protein
MSKNKIEIYCDIDTEDGGHGEFSVIPDPTMKINSVKIFTETETEECEFTFSDENVGNFFRRLADVMSGREILEKNKESISYSYVIGNNHIVTVSYHVEAQQIYLGNNHYVGNVFFRSFRYINRTDIVNVLNNLFSMPCVSL